MCVYICACVSLGGGVFVCAHIRVYVFIPMYVRFSMCVIACVCLPFVRVYACVLVSVRV